MIPLSYSNCKQVAFLQCQLHSSDLQNSKFLKVEFQESNLLQSQMNFTSLKGIDFTSCDIEYQTFLLPHAVSHILL